MKVRRLLLTVIILLFAAVFSACSQESSDMKDGYYTAEAASFDQNGWKEFLTIYVSDGKIITVEYDAFNASGFVKSWDIEYMRIMNNSAGTYPNEFTRTYAISLINWQTPDKVDSMTGATHSHTKFQFLAEAVIANAKAGDKRVALVEFPE